MKRGRIGCDECGTLPVACFVAREIRPTRQHVSLLVVKLNVCELDLLSRVSAVQCTQSACDQHQHSAAIPLVESPNRCGVGCWLELK